MRLRHLILEGTDAFRALILKLIKMEVSHRSDPFYADRLEKLADRVLDIMVPEFEDWIADAVEGDVEDYIISPNVKVLRSMLKASDLDSKLEAITMALNALHSCGRMVDNYLGLTPEFLRNLSNLDPSIDSPPP